MKKGIGPRALGSPFKQTTPGFIRERGKPVPEGSTEGFIRKKGPTMPKGPKPSDEGFIRKRQMPRYYEGDEDKNIKQRPRYYEDEGFTPPSKKETKPQLSIEKATPIKPKSKKVNVPKKKINVPVNPIVEPIYPRKISK
jgi:hypothetical protein